MRWLTRYLHPDSDDFFASQSRNLSLGCCQSQFCSTDTSSPACSTVSVSALGYSKAVCYLLCRCTYKIKCHRDMKTRMCSHIWYPAATKSSRCRKLYRALNTPHISSLQSTMYSCIRSARSKAEVYSELVRKVRELERTPLVYRLLD